MDELHPAVDTGQRSVDVGHETFLSSGATAAPASGRPQQRAGWCGCVGNGRRRAIQVPLWSPCLGAHGLIDGSTIHRSSGTGVATAGTAKAPAATRAEASNDAAEAPATACPRHPPRLSQCRRAEMAAGGGAVRSEPD